MIKFIAFSKVYNGSSNFQFCIRQVFELSVMYLLNKVKLNFFKLVDLLIKISFLVSHGLRLPILFKKED